MVKIKKMALWQYTFHLLPNINGELDVKNFSLENNEDGFDDSSFWVTERIDRAFFSKISAILPIGKSWSKNIDLYGDEKSNCFTVFVKDNIVQSVSFRVDITSNYEHVLTGIVDFCILNGFVIIDEDLKIIPLNYLTIKTILDSCIQHRKMKRFLGP